MFYFHGSEISIIKLCFILGVEILRVSVKGILLLSKNWKKNFARMSLPGFRDSDLPGKVDKTL